MISKQDKTQTYKKILVKVGQSINEYQTYRSSNKLMRIPIAIWLMMSIKISTPTLYIKRNQIQANAINRMTSTNYLIQLHKLVHF
jgi:hypothetical protein